MPLTTSDDPDSGSVIYPLVFGIIAPAVMLKDLLSKEIIRITGKGVSYKKGSAYTKIPYRNIDIVFFVHIRERIGLDFGDRTILFIYGKNKKESIACGNLFSDEDKNYLLETLQHYEPDNDYEIVHTENISEVFSYLSSGERGRTAARSSRLAEKGSHLPPHRRKTVPGGPGHGARRTRSCQYCDQPLSYIKEYQRWYCYDCAEYALKE